MLVAAVTVGIGLVCLYYGARSLRVGRAVRRLRGSGEEGPSHPTDWAEPADEGSIESGATVAERGSLERGFLLLALGALCLLFGVLIA
jgi:hypothetical protein